VELRTQINVSPQPERATNQPFSSPFEIANAGYLSFHVDHVIAVFPTVEYQNGLKFSYATVAGADWDDFDLDRGTSKTIYPYFSNGRPTKASIVIAVNYRNFGIHGRVLRRFDGTYIDTWQWSKQPIKAEDKPAVNGAVDDALRKHSAAQIRNRAAGGR
jgi:hypothetical protein